LERIGELRKGRSIACVGFPISNKEEIQTVLEKAGVDFIFLMTEKERLEYVEQRSGREMLNEMMDLIGRMHEYDVLIAIGCDKRTKLIEGLLEGEVISLSIGSSPITEDKWVDPQQVEEILRSIKTAR
jgi:hypothetical protein